MEKIRLSYRKIIAGVTGTIYEMHPYHMPENIDKIVAKLNEWYENTPDCTGKVNSTFKLFEWESFSDFEKWLKDFLMNIKEFRDLNISRKLKDQGVTDCEDERNQGMYFTSRYDVDTKDSRYGDFIDLDACIRNIIISIDHEQQMSDDCFLCTYAKEYGSVEPSDDERCKNCICNPKIRYNRETHHMALKPKKDWTKEEIEKYSIF